MTKKTRSGTVYNRLANKDVDAASVPTPSAPTAMPTSSVESTAVVASGSVWRVAVAPLGVSAALVGPMEYRRWAHFH